MKSQYWSIERLPGLNPQEQKLLQSQGINNTKDLLQQAHNSVSQQDLARRLRVNQKYVSKWVALADLARLPSVGDRYCGVLLHVGIISVVQLAQTHFPQLHRQIMRLQVAMLRQTEQVPSISQVQTWVAEAKILSNDKMS